MHDESTLLKAAKNMDRKALAALFDMYATAIFGYSMRVCHDPIESDRLVGDVFAQFLEKLAAGRGPVISLRSYLYQIAFRLIVDRPRHNHRMMPPKRVTAPQAVSANPTTQSAAEDRRLTEMLISSLNIELSELQRHVIILRFLEGFSLGETAAIVGRKVNNVKVIQNRGMAKLRSCLGLQVENGSQESPL